MSKALITPVTTAVTKEKFEESLSQWTPSTKKESIRMLHFISTLTKYGSYLKNECYSFLQEKAPSAKNAVDPESGLEVTLVTPSTKVYKNSPETEALEIKIAEATATLKELKESLKKQYEINGIDYEVDGEVYYKTK
mgnify:CR=1 FL=1